MFCVGACDASKALFKAYWKYWIMHRIIVLDAKLKLRLNPQVFNLILNVVLKCLRSGNGVEIMVVCLSKNVVLKVYANGSKRGVW